MVHQMVISRDHATGRGRRGRDLRLLALSVTVALALAGCSGVPGVYVVEKASDRTAGGASGTAAGQASGAFDATAYVAGIWESKVVPTIAGSAKDAVTVTAAIAADPAAAGKAYGRQTGSGSPFTYAVKGKGTVVATDTSEPSGTMSVDLAPGDGKPDLKIAVGPAILGTAVRDALPFIDFSQFTNQIDYADVGTALNNKVKEKVLSGIDPAAVKGRKVEFSGAFAVLDPKSLVLIPVTLTVTP